MSTVPTHCPYCALQCGMLVSEQRVRGNPEAPASRGQLCIKGFSAGGLLSRGDRILTPLVRGEDGQLRSATWDAALSRVAECFGRLRREYGPDSIGVFGSGALTNEKTYALGKFARVVLGTSNIDYNGRYCMASAAGALRRSLGMDRGLPFPLSDIGEADCVLSWGSNWAETMPPIAQWFDAMRLRGGTSIAVDPRRSLTAKMAEIHVQPVPGSDLALANGLLHILIEEGRENRRFIQERTRGFETVRATVSEYPPSRVERLTGVSERRMRQVVALMADAPRAILLSGRGPEQQSKGVDTVLALINFMLALGKIGVPGSGYGCLTGQGNGQGGREHGQKADQLPGYRNIEDPEHRRIVAEIWGVEPASLPGKGKSAFELLDSLGPTRSDGGGIRGLWIMGSNVAVASPDASRIYARLRSLDQLVVVDSYLNETTEAAHVVLPSLLWAEETGTLTNLEGRIVLREKAVEAPPGPRSDLSILRDLAIRLGHPGFLPSDDPEAVFAELARATAGGVADYSGLSHERLRKDQGLFWPCTSVEDPGSPRVFLDRFAHSDGRAVFCSVNYRDSAEVPDDEYPLYFTTGRYREHYNSGAQTRNIPELIERQPEPLLEVHPWALKNHSLEGQTHLLVETRRGAVRFRIRITRDIRPDTVFAPFHWGGESSANRLTIAALDPVSRMPEFKVCSARLREAPNS